MAEKMNIKVFHKTMEELSKGKVSRRAILSFYSRNQDLFEKTGKIYHFNKYNGHDLKTMFQSQWPIIAVPLLEKPGKVDEHLTSATSIKESDYRGTETKIGICILRRNSEIPMIAEKPYADGYVVVFLYHTPDSNIVTFYATSAEGNHRRSYTVILTNEVKKTNVPTVESDQDIPICPICERRPDFWRLRTLSIGADWFALYSNKLMKQLDYNKLVVKKLSMEIYTTLEDVIAVVCSSGAPMPHVFTSAHPVFEEVLEQAKRFENERKG